VPGLMQNYSSHPWDKPVQSLGRLTS
jgi:hypothetical protein